MIESNTKTSLFMPSWWVEFFDQSVSQYSIKEDDDNFLNPLSRKVCPNFNQKNLSILALLIDDFQKQIIGFKKEPTLFLEPATFIKKLPPSICRYQHILKNFLYSLPGLRILSNDEDQQRSISLFEKESWVGNCINDLKLKLWMSRNCTELLMGYVNPFEELNRMLGNDIRLLDNMGAKVPTPIQYPIWIALQGLEQVIYLRLLVAMSNESNMCNTDGGFFIASRDLFKNLFLIERKSHSYSNKIRILQKFVKTSIKFHEHGFLDRQDIHCFNALYDGTSKEQDVSIIWKSKDKSLREHCKVFEINVAKVFVYQSLNLAFFHKIVELEKIQLSILDQEPIKGMLSYLCTQYGYMDCVDGSDYILIDGNILLPTIFLFVEWVIRINGSHSSDFPPWFLVSKIINELKNFREIEQFDSAYKTFRLLIKNDERVLNFLSETTNLSHFSQVLKNNEKIDSFPEVARTTIDSRDSDHFIQQTYSHDSSSTLKPLTNLGNNKSKDIKKYATDKLNRLLERNSDEYEKIKNHYMSSLDSESRRTVLTVKKSMQPEVFDKHLHQRLVRYVVENPTIWKSEKPLSLH